MAPATDWKTRRRYPRVNISVPVRVARPNGTTWTGESENLSPLGIKVRDGVTEVIPIVRLEFEIPGRVPTLSVTSFTVRNDRDGVAFVFIDLARPAFALLRAAVDRLLLSRKLWVAIIENDPDMASMLAEYVEGHGHTPIVLPSAEEALGYLRHDRPDALLLDLELPGMRGVEFLQRLARQGAWLPVLVLSGGEAEALRCLELGALDFVPKPVSGERLRLALQALEFKGLEARLADVEAGLGY
jgi:CheY-like chemotaxis protein